MKHGNVERDAAISSVAAQRNRGPILEVLLDVLPTTGRVLEIASGTGEHVSYFAAATPGLQWQPSDLDPARFDSVCAWVQAGGVSNVREPMRLDASAPPWPVEPVDAVVCCNMVHIAPWEACVGLFAGAAQVIGPGGVLVTYGPYKRDGVHTAPSNEAFDESLRARDPAWGVRDIGAMQDAAGDAFVLEAVRPMPANNFTLIWRRQ